MISFLNIWPRRHHHEPQIDGRLVDDGIRFLQAWETDDGRQPWRAESDATRRTTVKALLAVKRDHAAELRERGHGDG